MLNVILSSGFSFLKNLNDTETVYENKFTGLWLVYNSKLDTYKVVNS